MDGPVLCLLRIDRHAADWVFGASRHRRSAAVTAMRVGVVMKVHSVRLRPVVRGPKRRRCCRLRSSWEVTARHMAGGSALIKVKPRQLQSTASPRDFMLTAI